MAATGDMTETTFTGEVRAPDLLASGLTGATAASRYVGATASGPPTSGTFAVGDYVIDHGGKPWLCTVAGSPGTWNAPVNWRGAWDASVSYTANDLVTYNNLLWVAGTASTGTTPATSSVYMSTVLVDAPTAYYRVGDAVGAGSAADTSGNGNTGLVRGSVTFAAAGALTGDSDTACTINNNNSAVVEPTNYSNPTTYSMECWFKSSASGTIQGIFCFEDSSNAQTATSTDRRTWLDSTGHLNLEGVGATSAAYNDGQWHHCVTTRGSGTSKSYVDGTQVLSGADSPANYSGFWHWGTASVGGTWGNLVGTMDELAFYNAAVLSAARVTAHYTAGHTANPWTVVVTNPMTTQGDMITAGSSGQPARVTAGASSTLLQGGTTPAFSAAPTVTGEVTASDFKPSGLTGATSASRYVGATTSGAPASGTFAVGDFIVDRTGRLYICTTAGSPGTWTAVAGGAIGTGLLNWLAGWDATIAYNPNDVVFYNGVAWVAVTGSTGSAPTAASSVSLWQSTVPTNTNYGVGAAATIGVEFYSDTAGVVNGVRFYKGSSDTGTHTVGLWDTTGSALLASITVTGETSSGWQTMLFSAPVSLTAGHHYRAAYYTPAGVSSWAGAPSPQSPLHSVGYFVNGSGSLTYPSTSNGNAWGIDVSFAPIGNTWAPLDTILATTQTANTVLAGPSSGSAAIPVMRALVSADMPNAPTVSGEVTASDFKPSGLTGATAASRYVGATASGAPASGTFAVGDYVVDQTGKIWLCSGAGTPGTWVQHIPTPLTTKGDIWSRSTVDARQAVGADGTFLAADSSQATGLSYKFPAGIAGVSTLSSALASNQTISTTYVGTSTYNDIVTLSLTAGTWLLLGDLQYTHGASGTDVSVVIWDGTTTYASNEQATSNSTYQSFSLSAVVSPTSTTTYKLGLALWAQQPGTVVATTNLFGSKPKTTQLVAVQLTGAPASGPGALMPAVRCYNSANISIPNSTFTTLTFDTNRVDQGTSAAQHSTSSNTGRLTCRQAGLYQISGTLEFAGSASGTFRAAQIRLNGATVIGYDGGPTASIPAAIRVTPTTLYQLSVGDYVELLAYQDTGGALNVTSAGNYSPEFGMARIDSGPGAVQPNTKVQLDYAASTDLISGVSLTGYTTWVDVCSNQTFAIDDANSSVDVSVAGYVFVTGGNGECSTRVIIDSAGTPLTKSLGGGPSVNTNALSGSSLVSISGLSAGSHTIKIQVAGNNGSAYLRASSFPGTETLSVRVLERKQSSSPPSSTPAPAVRCYNSANISLPSSGSYTFLTFDTNRYDQGTGSPQHSTSSNTSRLTCQQAGVYDISGCVQWSSISGALRALGLRINGSTYIAEEYITMTINSGPTITISTQYYLNVGDYVELGALQNSGSTLNVVAAPNESPEFMMARVDTGGGYGGTYLTAAASSDTTLTGSYADILTLDVTAGTWLLQAYATFQGNGGDNVYHRLWDGTTEFAHGLATIPSFAGALIVSGLHAVVTPTMTTTYHLQAHGGSSARSNLDGTNTSIRITALKIA